VFAEVLVGGHRSRFAPGPVQGHWYVAAGLTSAGSTAGKFHPFGGFVARRHDPRLGPGRFHLRGGHAPGLRRGAAITFTATFYCFVGRRALGGLRRLDLWTRHHGHNFNLGDQARPDHNRRRQHRQDAVHRSYLEHIAAFFIPGGVDTLHLSLIAGGQSLGLLANQLIVAVVIHRLSDPIFRAAHRSGTAGRAVARRCR